jgi:hypothetical protein
MTQTIWVRPKGPPVPRPGTTLRAQLEQNVSGRPLHAVGEAEVYEGGMAMVRLIDTSAGVEAAILLREGLVDPRVPESQPTLRLR